MAAFKVTVTRTLEMLVGQSPGPESAEKFVQDLLDAGQIGESDWDQVITVEPLTAETATVAGKD